MNGRGRWIVVGLMVWLALVDVVELFQLYRVMVTVGLMLVACVVAQGMVAVLRRFPTRWSNPQLVGVGRLWILMVCTSLLIFWLPRSAVHVYAVVSLVNHLALAMALWPKMPPRRRKQDKRRFPTWRAWARPVMGGG